jgi:hypothetical protein
MGRDGQTDNFTNDWWQHEDPRDRCGSATGSRSLPAAFSGGLRLRGRLRGPSSPRPPGLPATVIADNRAKGMSIGQTMDVARSSLRAADDGDSDQEGEQAPIGSPRASIEHREDLVRTRTQTVNRLHALVTKLLPAGLPRKLTAETASAALRCVRPRATLGRTLRALAVELVAEIRRLDQRISSVADQISAAVTESGTTLSVPESRPSVVTWVPRSATDLAAE